MMNVEHAEFVEVDGRPALYLRIDGKAAWIYTPKRTLLELGYVTLVDDIAQPANWAEHLPILTVPADPEQGRGELELHGATNDSLVVNLASHYWNVCSGYGNFEPGVLDLDEARARLAGK